MSDDNDNDNDQSSIIVESASSETKDEYQRLLGLAIEKLKILPNDASNIERAKINLDMAEAKIGMGETAAAWEMARDSLDIFVADESWQNAVEACEVLYQTNEPSNDIALAHGIWLAITYPIDPQTTVTLLNYFVDETPKHSDGAAVAAATAHYIAGIRASDEDYEGLSFLTRNLIARVAERHSNIHSQEALDAWMTRLEINDPKVFLPRMGRVLDIIVMDKWWIDRETLRANLPVN